MFVVLTLVSLEMIKQINQEKPLADFGDKRKRVEPKHASIEQLFVRAVYSLALVLITLTGVFPAIDKENENREEAPKIERTSNDLHTFGVLTACSTLVLGMAMRAILFCDWRSRPIVRANRNDCFKYLYRVAWMAFAVSFYYCEKLTTGSMKYSAFEYDTSNLCLGIGNKTMCEKWPLGDVRLVSNGICWGNLKIPEPLLYECAWLDGALYKHDANPADDSTAPVKGGYCDRVKCPLFARSRVMVLEFSLLFLSLAYFQTWGSQEVGRVLVKRRSTATRTKRASVLGGDNPDDDGHMYFRLGVQHSPEPTNQGIVEQQL